MLSLRIPYPLTFTGVLLSLSALLLATTGFGLPGAFLCLIAYFLISKELIAISVPFQFAATRVTLLCLGWCIDTLYSGFPYYTILGFMIPQASILRLELYRYFGISKYSGLEAFFFGICVLIYVKAGLMHPADWKGWGLMLLPMFIAGMITTGIFSDRQKFKKLGVSGFKAEVGKLAPDFSLPDTESRNISLSDFKGKNHVLLIFVRGDWCPTCHIMLRSYEKNREKFLQKNIQVIGIGPDPSGINKKMVERLGMKNYMLSDEGQRVSSQYGINFFENTKQVSYSEGIPLPAAFLIDKEGIVRFTSRADKPGELFHPEQIFPILEALA